MRKVRKLVKISLLLTKFDSKSFPKMGRGTLTTYAKREIEELMDNRIVQRCHLAPTIVEVTLETHRILQTVSQNIHKVKSILDKHDHGRQTRYRMGREDLDQSKYSSSLQDWKPISRNVRCRLNLSCLGLTEFHFHSLH